MTHYSEHKPHVAIACGGTGGHLFPGLAVAEQLIARGCTVTALISPKDVDQQAVKSVRGVEVVTLPAVALQTGSRMAFFGGFVKSFRAARTLFKTRRPDAVLAMGGFTSAPPVLAAKAMGVKTFLHESNTIPGKANRWLARFVHQAFVGFSEAEGRIAAREAIITGTPVRVEFQCREVAVCRIALGLDAARPVVLVTGGSQGARGVNDLIIGALPMLARHALQWQWLHLAGANDVEKVKQAYAKHELKAVVHPFLSQMDLALGAATACVSRAGASSLAEIAAMRLPTLLVPLPTSADNHQWHNARAFEETGAARLLQQSDATPEKVSRLLRELVDGTDEREEMRSALSKWHEPKAAAKIAEAILVSLGRTKEKSTRLQAPTPAEIPRSNQQVSLSRATQLA
ncbi:MAG: undecaprenyldiphospho-muramoylpentapeptide beta-N-acetylglucosaminyltransferase [Verrucomicrobia bacterium]|jgi:UDP-N-acetylglucosamine--N-acetylmuramyl-(pentapeptide) pyrophosphoryl-undecaprenol N-acetylglucosamine transferase|nr:MAG: undecaprenyldiphospho-muramoylpentapeptide beta-N-acetylglucosaminyltransferase [Verrucomicrobiota bacterium]